MDSDLDPGGWTCEESPAIVRLHRPLGSAATIVYLVVMLGFLIGVVIFLICAIQLRSVPLIATAAVLLLTNLAGLYLGAATSMNRLSVELGPQKLVVRVGPVPMRADVVIARNRIKDLAPAPSASIFGLCPGMIATLDDGTHPWIFAHPIPEADAHYLQQLLLERLRQ